MEIERKIKVYCPEHQSTCEVTAKPHIVCTIEEHALSNNFPKAEYWEFCADCQTFLPTKLAVGVRAVAICPNCSREPVRRFLCEHCHIETFESDEPARGKIYRLGGEKGIEPKCPGCEFSPNQKVLKHQCETLKISLFTARETCPFCLQKTKPNDKTFQPSQSTSAANNGVCPQCSAKNPPNTIFCGKCRYQLLKEVTVSNLGSEINKTQLLGSLCPNCSTPIPPDSGFCGECGQAVKKALPPPPPPPSKNVVSHTASVDLLTSPTTGSTSNTTVRNIGIGIGGVFLFIVFLAIVSSNSKSSSSSDTTNSKSNSDLIFNSRISDNSSTISTTTYQGNVSRTPNKSDSDSRIERTGTLNMDSNLRESPNKDSAWLGTHYRGAKVKILDVATVPNSLGGMTDWFKIEVISYGNSMDTEKYGQYGKDYGSEDFGWVNSYPEVYEGNRKVRKTLINFD